MIDNKTPTLLHKSKINEARTKGTYVSKITLLCVMTINLTDETFQVVHHMLEDPSECRWRSWSEPFCVKRNPHVNSMNVRYSVYETFHMFRFRFNVIISVAGIIKYIHDGMSTGASTYTWRRSWHVYTYIYERRMGVGSPLTDTYLYAPLTDRIVVGKPAIEVHCLMHLRVATWTTYLRLVRCLKIYLSPGTTTGGVPIHALK